MMARSIFLWSLSALVLLMMTTTTEADHLECKYGLVEDVLVMNVCYVWSADTAFYLYCDASNEGKVDYFRGEYLYSDCDMNHVDTTLTLVQIFGANATYTCGKCDNYVTYREYADCNNMDVYTSRTLPLGCHNNSIGSVSVSCSAKDGTSMSVIEYMDDTCGADAGAMINSTTRSGSCGTGPNKNVGSAIKVTACMSGAVAVIGSSPAGSLLFLFFIVAVAGIFS
jgi:hypothetical protein